MAAYISSQLSKESFFSSWGLTSGSMVMDRGRPDRRISLSKEARPWITGDPSSPRRAAVLMGDFSDRRAALILEEEPTMEDRT